MAVLHQLLPCLAADAGSKIVRIKGRHTGHRQHTACSHIQHNGAAAPGRLPAAAAAVHLCVQRFLGSLLYIGIQSGHEAVANFSRFFPQPGHLFPLYIYFNFYRTVHTAQAFFPPFFQPAFAYHIIETITLGFKFLIFAIANAAQIAKHMGGQ